MSKVFVGGAIVAVILLSSNVAAALAANPGTIVFESLEDTAAITVTKDGQPVSIESVKSHELYVHEHTYGYMVDVSAADGKLVVKPDVIEAGTYTLVANTDKGEVRVKVEAPLSKLPTTYEQQAELLGITVDELKLRLGLSDLLGEQRIDITLPSVYYVGQTMDVDAGPTQNMVTWGINGQVEKEGLGAHSFEYTFAEPGDYLLTYVESRDGSVVASDTAVTRVLEQPAVLTEARPNSIVTLMGPSGYTDYTWLKDGEVIGNDQGMKFQPAAPGRHTVVCRAQHPVGGGDSFDERRYVVNVTQDLAHE